MNDYTILYTQIYIKCRSYYNTLTLSRLNNEQIRENELIFYEWFYFYSPKVINFGHSRVTTEGITWASFEKDVRFIVFFFPDVIKAAH